MALDDHVDHIVTTDRLSAGQRDGAFHNEHAAWMDEVWSDHPVWWFLAFITSTPPSTCSAKHSPFAACYGFHWASNRPHWPRAGTPPGLTRERRHGAAWSTPSDDAWVFVRLSQ